MALKQILEDFQQEVSGVNALDIGSLASYPKHFNTTENGGFNYAQSNTPIFDGIITFTGGTDENGYPTFTTTRFRQKNFKFGEFPSFDRPNLGFSPEPFIKKTLNLGSSTDVGSIINTVTDGTIRGGVLLHTERNLTDVARITKWGITPKGLAWNVKQLGLQMTNPKISQPTRSTGASNQRTYNPLNTLAQIGVEGTGLRFTREGALGFAGVHTGYLDHKKILGQEEDEEDKPSSKLSTLYVDHILEDKSHDSKGKGGQKPGPAKEGSKVGNFLRKAVGAIGDTINSFINKDGEPLYDYAGGPGSLYGIGRTRIKKYAPFVNEGIDKHFGSQDGYAVLLDRTLYETGYPYGGIVHPSYPQLNLDGFEGINYHWYPIYSKYHSYGLKEADGEAADFDRLTKEGYTERDNLKTHRIYPGAGGIFRIGDKLPPISSRVIGRNGDELVEASWKYITNQASGATTQASKYGLTKTTYTDPENATWVSYSGADQPGKGLGEWIDNDTGEPVVGTSSTEYIRNALSQLGPNMFVKQNPLNYKDYDSIEALATAEHGYVPDKDIGTGHLLDENLKFDFHHKPIKLYEVQDFRMIKRGIEEPKGDVNVDNQNITNYKASTNLGKSGFYRETRVNTGNVGKNMDNSLDYYNHFGKITRDYDKFDPDVIDKINALDVYREGVAEGDRREKSHMRDLVRLKIEALDSSNPTKSETMLFRAFLGSFSDKYTGDWNSFKYNGRAEDFYTYKGFKRSITFDFKIAAQTRHEMLPLFRKLNFLATQTAPDYQNTRMRGSFCRLTIGSMLQRTPGFFTSVSIKWNKNYPWDIAINHLEDGPDKDGMNVMPHLLDVSCQFTPVHAFIPQKSVWKTPFILPHRGTSQRRNWSSQDAAPNSDAARFDKGERWKAWNKTKR